MNLVYKITLFAFFLNLLYELLHSLLYTTCLKAPLKKYVYLILKGAAFDALVIGIIYQIGAVIFQEQNPFRDIAQIGAFAAITIVFAYIWEIYSLKKKKWEYSEKMPTVLGAGITPLVQLTLTGVCSLYLALN